MPLVVIIMTWPTFARLFNGDEFWLHARHRDAYQRIWDAWRLERVLAGKEQLFYTNIVFHPQGLNLAFQHISLPHALLFIVFEKLMPADSAYNLLFLLILCFNAFCAYVLMLHLLRDKWIALFGAIVVAVSVPFPYGSTVPDLIMIGTIPLTIYFYHRYVTENRWLFAALAGLCAGVTAFIGVYNFVFILLTIGILGLFWSASRWKQPCFWRGIALFVIVCASISAFRFYPMLVDPAILKEGFETHFDRVHSYDVMHCCVITSNPFTGDLFGKLFALLSDSAQESFGPKHNRAYLGYINLFFLLCAILPKPLRRRMAPWLAVLICFAVLRLGHFLTVFDIEYRHILLPEHYLTHWFPALFGNIYLQEYYQFGAVVPLAVLASFGLARLVQSKTTAVRVIVVLISVLVLAIEYFNPFSGFTEERQKTAFIDWLSTETDNSIKLINLPQQSGVDLYSRYFQTIHEYPIAFGATYRNLVSARAYIRSNAFLNAWRRSRSVHCLPYNERAYLRALEQLLADGFTHIVVHHWLYGDHFVNPSFWNVPAAYDDGLVSVYRLPDLRLSCQRLPIALPQFSHLAADPATVPGARSSILSFHPNESIDEDLFDYLASLFSDWRSLAHLYLEDGEPVIQSAGRRYQDIDAFARDNQVIYLVHNSRDTDPAALRSNASMAGLELCQRETHEDGSVIERYLSREFSCALIDAGRPLRVDYDNGARIENALLAITPDQLDLQIIWSNLPSKQHSLSLQVFDAAGVKVLSQDAAIGHVSLARHHIDLATLPPGEYAVKLIVYEFAAGRSVSGTLSGSGARFLREMELAVFERT